jgi:uncharacterized protein
MRAAILLAAFLWTAPAFAIEPVIDNAGVLDGQQYVFLREKLMTHYNNSHVSVVVMTTPSLGGKQVEEFSLDVARELKIGAKGEDSGLLLLVAPNERKMRVEVGYGMEGEVTDKQAKDALETMKPFLKDGKWYFGINAGVNELIALTKNHQIKGDADVLNSQDQGEYALTFLCLALIGSIMAIGMFWVNGGFSKNNSSYEPLWNRDDPRWGRGQIPSSERKLDRTYPSSETDPILPLSVAAATAAALALANRREREADNRNRDDNRRRDNDSGSSSGWSSGGSSGGDSSGGGYDGGGDFGGGGASSDF